MPKEKQLEEDLIKLLMGLRSRIQILRERSDIDINIPINSSRVLVKEGVY